MGDIQNAVNQTISRIGVGAHADKLAPKKENKNISSANDGQKNKTMGEKARQNKEALKQQKLSILRKTQATLSGANSNPRDRAELVSEIKGGR